MESACMQASVSFILKSSKATKNSSWNGVHELPISEGKKVFEMKVSETPQRLPNSPSGGITRFLKLEYVCQTRYRSDFWSLSFETLVWEAKPRCQTNTGFQHSLKYLPVPICIACIILNYNHTGMIHPLLVDVIDIIS